MFSKAQSFKIALWTILILIPSHQAQGTIDHRIGRDEVGICAIKGHRFHIKDDVTCTHKDRSLETVAIKRSIFNGLLLVYQKGLDHSKELLRMIHDAPQGDLTKINQIELKRRRIGAALKILDDLPRNGVGRDDQGELAHFFARRIPEMRSCYNLRKIIHKRVRDAVPCSLNPSSFVNSCKYRIPHSNWYTNKERLMVSNIVLYYPKWWEHTDLGFACELFIKKTKGLTPLDLRSWGWDRRRDEVSNIDFEGYKRQATQNIKSLEKAIHALEHVIGLEALEARYHANDSSKKGKLCSPHTATRLVANTETGPDPDWHRLFSHAILDARQNFPSARRPDWVTPKPFSAFISKHPYPNYSGPLNLYRRHLMILNVLYPIYLSTYDPGKKDDPLPPGMPMLLVPGMDYVAPEMTKDPDALGITVYSHPLAVCTPQSDDTKRAIRIFN